MTLERVLCRTFPGSKISSVSCNVKHIDRKNLKILVAANVTTKLQEIFVVVKPYFKFNTYTRIAGHIYASLCDWIAGKKSHFITDFYLKELINHTNANHTCPYFPGQLLLKIDNISTQEFGFPQIMPAGRYRLDVSITESDVIAATPQCEFSIYCSVSDHRIEVV